MRITFILLMISCLMAGAFGQSAPGPAGNSGDSEKAVYIPAGRRHQGLSRYDLIPFTDRIKGDPDRYRAVNPKYVRRENGRYYYSLTAKSGTHFYDDKLQDQGALPDPKIEVDLTQTSTAPAADGKSVKYVSVKDQGWILSTAVEETPEQIRSGKWFGFPVKPGKNIVYDGTGIERGELAAGIVRLNYGLQKQIKGETYYYAFSTKMKSGGETRGASGWIKASAIEPGNDPQFDRKYVDRMQMPTTADDVFTVYEITGGDPEEITGKDANGKPIYKFGYADKRGEYTAYKVLPKIPLEGPQSVAATDYLRRADGVINLGFNPAGVSNDTFRIAGAGRPLIFYRSSEKDATVAIDLFYAKDAAHTGEEIAGQMIFVYGYVDLADGKRWGWIPLAALRPKSNGKPRS